MNLDAVGGRRFILAVLTLTVCSFLLGFKLLTDGSFTAIILATVGAYIAAGTFERSSEIKADVTKTVAATQAGNQP
jgi:hypothetical protein